MPISGYPLFEFHISRQARLRYQFDETLFSQQNNVIFANFHAARSFAQKMNRQRDLARFPEQVVRAGQINAMGLIDEILHLVMRLYREQERSEMMADALTWLYGMLGKEAVDETLQRFVEAFPPQAVYKGEQSAAEYMLGDSQGIPNAQIQLEELLMLWLANSNPALASYNELFDSSQLEKETAYLQIIHLLHAFFETQPTFGPDDQNIVDMLRQPAIAVPHSIEGQIDYIRQRWGYLLGKYLYRLLSSLDFIKEEEKAIFLGPGLAQVLTFAGYETEVERFSPDMDWMPHVVMIAKNVYVWLDQLSKRYPRNIRRLDDIPDEELDNLARWGFTSLWLIGLWERSSASQRIKQLRGNPEAVASAYSLFDYSIAADLGGDEAFQKLRKRAWQRGIRLASDMVPNHMGIDSRWVVEHPDWFLQLDYSPFPAYSFNGPNLSWDSRTGIYIEDHYYDNSDAAVVFKRVDYWSGQERYIYHGNDGTSMPWNDTAQLNYLIPEVREAVIQTILHVARMFPIIRFDAAMTLAKKHYQRLWFPEPGGGGAIPTRAEHGMNREQFNAAFPVEFWREVVDRVSQEAPHTLLLAEAFWLMEGYFVRSLGMHRVYNSAFMNMLRDEKNAEYRLVMKNTLEFDPEILKRYVNFMNNPDERTAVDQFGKGDKYFGICALLATLPGLPMFGHGQIEGFTEKYGMEYRRAYWDEIPDDHLRDRHIREIFPLLRKRYLFAEVRDFLLYDFFSSEGFVNEDVFAYTNRAGEERALVIYNNRFAHAAGWIRTSAAYALKDETGERKLQQKKVIEGLDLINAQGWYTIFRDQIDGLEYLRNNQELAEKGLFFELEAYQCRVFLDFRQSQESSTQPYSHLAALLNGRGVENIDEALKAIFLQPIHQPFQELVNPGYYQWLMGSQQFVESSTWETKRLEYLTEAEGKILPLLQAVQMMTGGVGDAEAVTFRMWNKLEAGLTISSSFLKSEDKSRDYKKLRAFLNKQPLMKKDATSWGIWLSWLFTHELGLMVDQEGYAEISRSWLDEWMLNKIITAALLGLNGSEGSTARSLSLIKLLISYHNWHVDLPGSESDVSLLQRVAHDLVFTLLSDREAQQYLHINRYQEILWFNKESFEELIGWLFLAALVNYKVAQPDINHFKESIGVVYQVISLILEAEEASQYQVEKLLDRLS